MHKHDYYFDNIYSFLCFAELGNISNLKSLEILSVVVWNGTQVMGMGETTFHVFVFAKLTVLVTDQLGC